MQNTMSEQDTTKLIKELDKQEVCYSLDEAGIMCFNTYEDYLQAVDIAKKLGVGNFGKENNKS